MKVRISRGFGSGLVVEHLTSVKGTEFNSTLQSKGRKSTAKPSNSARKFEQKTFWPKYQI